jgi:DNA-binding NarL/FixJ family response regulator
MTRTLFIVDDHPQFRSFARALLDAEGFDVTGEAEDGETAVEAVERLNPDVVLLDIQLPGIDGFEVAERLARLPGGPRVVLTSSREATDYGTRISDAPVRGFIAKRELSGQNLVALVASA